MIDVLIGFVFGSAAGLAIGYRWGFSVMYHKAAAVIREQLDDGWEETGLLRDDPKRKAFTLLKTAEPQPHMSALQAHRWRASRDKLLENVRPRPG